MAVTAAFSMRGSSAVPALPGATSTRVTLPDWTSFQASACSRPPEPMTRTFMSGWGAFCRWLVAEVAEAGEDHCHAMFVGCGNHLFIAHRAAGLDHSGGAGVGEHVQPVAEREEGVGRDHRAADVEAGVLGLDGGNAGRID